MRVWYFIAYAYSCFLNMHGYEPSVARSRFDFVMYLYLHPSLWRRGAEGVMVKLSPCTAASTHWRLNDCTIYIKHLMSWLIFFTKQTVLLLKVVTSM